MRCHTCRQASLRPAAACEPMLPISSCLLRKPVDRMYRAEPGGPGCCSCLAFSLGLGLHLSEDFLRHVERGVRRRYAAVYRALQKYFLDLVARHAVIERRANVQLELFAAIERDHHGDRDQAARVSRQPRTGPDLPPGVTRDQILELAVEVVAPRQSAIDMRVAQDSAPHGH